MELTASVTYRQWYLSLIVLETITTDDIGTYVQWHLLLIVLTVNVTDGKRLVPTIFTTNIPKMY